MCTSKMFQPTRPRGARPVEVMTSKPASTFQPTRPRGARLTLALICGVDRKFQPTRPRGARQSVKVSKSTSPMFQPTRPRGARRSGGSAVNYRIRVSTHAPARGATQGCPDLHAQSCRFNPRAREGRDADVIDAKRIWSSFNPRAREGRDVCDYRGVTVSTEFQPTRPRGARLQRWLFDY